MGPHWNPRTDEVAIVLYGQGMVEVVCPGVASETGCQNSRFKVEEGDVFVVPKYHPMTQISFNNDYFVFLGFMKRLKDDVPQTLTGKLSILQKLDRNVLGKSFNVRSTTLDWVLADKKERYIYECISCAEAAAQGESEEGSGGQGGQQEEEESGRGQEGQQEKEEGGRGQGGQQEEEESGRGQEGRKEKEEGGQGGRQKEEGKGGKGRQQEEERGSSRGESQEGQEGGPKGSQGGGSGGWQEEQGQGGPGGWEEEQGQGGSPGGPEEEQGQGGPGGWEWGPGGAKIPKKAGS